MSFRFCYHTSPAVLGRQGVETFFGEVHKDTSRYPDTSRSWSADTLEAGCYIVPFAILLLYVPCLAKKFCGCGDSSAPYRGTDEAYLERTRQLEMADTRRSSLPAVVDPTPELLGSGPRLP